MFKYFKSKSKSRKNVSTLKTKSGSLTESPSETAEVLADFFHSVHSPEEHGPLPQKCYKNYTGNEMNELKITTEQVKVLLSKLNVGKSMGPDGIHPKNLKYLSEEN